MEIHNLVMSFQSIHIGFSDSLVNNTNPKEDMAHTGEKTFQCDICSNQYVSNTSLNEHMMIHTGVKLLYCSFVTNHSHKIVIYKSIQCHQLAKIHNNAAYVINHCATHDNTHL